MHKGEDPQTKGRGSKPLCMRPQGRFFRAIPNDFSALVSVRQPIKKPVGAKGTDGHRFWEAGVWQQGCCLNTSGSRVTFESASPACA